MAQKQSQDRPDTERTRRATDHAQAALPSQGEIYRCAQCGMEMKVTVDCNCSDPEEVRLECCGQELERV